MSLLSSLSYRKKSPFIGIWSETKANFAKGRSPCRQSLLLQHQVEIPSKANRNDRAIEVLPPAQLIEKIYWLIKLFL